MAKYNSNAEQHYYGFIDGLRGLAVLMVLIFHLAPSALSGGFIGVDVFFTISGFLISQILLEKKELPYLQFILARTRRLAPAMTLVLTSVAIIGVFVVALPSEVNALSKSVITSSGYISNIFYYTSANYFDSTKENNMLLHTWSLAVEWQFYFVYPLLIYIFSRRYQPKWLLIIITIVSLLAAQIYISQNISGVFYLTPFRAFEFSVGGLVYILFTNYKSTLTSIRARTLFTSELVILAALATLVLLSIFYNKTTIFPAINALWISAATGLIIIAGLTFSKDSRALLFIDNRILRYLGNISYSLYLWHWPIIVATRMYEPDLHYSHLILIGIISLILAHLTNRHFENRFRQNTKLNNKSSVFLATVPFIIGVTIYGLNKFEPNMFDKLTDRERRLLNVQKWEEVPGLCNARHSTNEYFDCIIGDTAVHPSLLVYGDSHAQMYVWALHKKLLKIGWSARYMTKGGCPPLINSVPKNTSINKSACLKLQKLFSEVMRDESRFKSVLLSARWNIYKDQPMTGSIFTEELYKVVELVEKKADKIFIIDSLPEAPSSVPELIVRNLTINRDLKGFKNNIPPLAAIQPLQSNKVKIINIQEILCDDESFCPFFINNQNLAYFDSNHLTEEMTFKVLVTFFDDLTENTGHKDAVKRN